MSLSTVGITARRIALGLPAILCALAVGGSMASAKPFDPEQFFGPAFLQSAEPLNPTQAVSSLNDHLRIPTSRVDAKLMVTEQLNENNVSSVLVFVGETGNSVKGEIYTYALTQSELMLEAIKTELADVGILADKVRSMDASVVSFVLVNPVNPISFYYTALSMSVQVRGSDHCWAPVTIIQTVAFSTDVITAKAQHASAVHLFAENTPFFFPPGRQLPNGGTLPAAPPSPHAVCASTLGPRPGTQGLTDPCDKATAELAQCLWDEQCAAINASRLAVRKTVTGGLGVVGSLAIGAGVALCAPVSLPVLILTGCTMLVGCWLSVDTMLDSRDAVADAVAALQRRDACWKPFLSVLRSGACN